MSSIAHNFAGGVQDLYGTTYNRVHQAAQQTTSGPAAHPPSAGVQGFGTASNDNRMSTLGYDANRLNANDNLATYGYDAEGSGQLRTAATTATGTATYRYDPFGRRYSKTVGGITTVYLQDEAGQDWAEYDGATGHALRYHAYTPGEVAPVVTTGPSNDAATVRLSIVTLLKDRLGSVVGTANWPGNQIGRVGYLPFGQSSTGTPPAGSGFGFAGYRYDPESGTYFVRARSYNPRTARFLQTDPIRQDGGLNLYTYANNDPINLTDPSGLSPTEGGGKFSLIPGQNGGFSGSPLPEREVTANLAAAGGLPTSPKSLTASPGSDGNIQLAAKSPTLNCQNVECGAPTGGAVYPLCADCNNRLMNRGPPILLENGQVITRPIEPGD